MDERILYSHVELATELANISLGLTFLVYGEYESKHIPKALQEGLAVCQEVKSWRELTIRSDDHFTARSLDQERFVRNLEQIPEGKVFLGGIDELVSYFNHATTALQKREISTEIQTNTAKVSEQLSILSLALLQYDALQGRIQRGEFRDYS